MIPPEDVDLADLEVLFDRALGLDPLARTAFIDEVRSRHPGLATELESLLEVNDSSGDFLATPVSLEQLLDGEDDGAEGEAPGDRSHPEALIGATVGGYRVLGLLGSGGMSDVYEAEQDQPRRRVALKVLLDSVTSAGTRARFADEAQALARLDHPNVARVFGAGRSDDPGAASEVRIQGAFSWIAVERINEPAFLTDHAESRGLDLRGRVRLFLPICDAVHHAHQKGVLHRDLKPANLLVSGDTGTPKVIDFGLARMLEPLDPKAQGRTRSGELLGTLRYMSPEQCGGDAGSHDVRTDGYALGVVLHELLTGELPYDLESRSLLEIIETIRSTPARDPGELSPELAGDLGAVLLTALAKAPEQRYDSVAALRSDLARWLNHEPVLARRATVLHRLRLFARRRTGLFVGISAGLVAALLAVVAIAVLAVVNQRSLRDLREAEAEAGRQELLVKQARFDLGDLRDQLAEVLVRQVAGERGGASTPEEGRLLVARAVARLAELAPLLEHDIASAASLAEAFVKVGDLHGFDWTAGEDDARASLEAYQRALTLQRRVVAARPADRAAAAAIVDVLVKVVQTHRKVNAAPAARSLADEAVLLARRGVDEQLDNRAARERLVNALWARGDLHIAMEPFEVGIEDSREALAVCDAMLEQHGGDPRSAAFAAMTLMRLGIWTERIESDPEGAFACHRRGNDLLVASLQRGGSTEERSRAASTLFSMLLWNEVYTGVRAGVPEADQAARLVELLEVGHRFEGDRGPILHALTWMTSKLCSLEPAGACEAWRRDLFALYEELGGEAAGAAVNRTRDLLDRYQTEDPSQLLPALDARFGPARD